MMTETDKEIAKYAGKWIAWIAVGILAWIGLSEVLDMIF